MTTLERRNLLAGLDRKAATVPHVSLAQMAEQRGFVDTPAPADRRYRQKTGRDQPFSVRLRAATRAAIYAQANDRDIPVAQVIEEAMACLATEQAGQERR